MKPPARPPIAPVAVQALKDGVAQAGACPSSPPGPAASAAAPASASMAGFSDAQLHAIRDLFGGDAGLFESFLDLALRQFALDREALAAALQAADWPAVHRQAHSLKGALATLGDAVGQALAHTLESAAAIPDIGASRQAWQPLDQHLADMKRA